jgi:ABC-type lipoprotein release transport system permease subunit
MDNPIFENIRPRPAQPFLSAIALGLMFMRIVRISRSLRSSRRFIIATILKESVIINSLGALLGICVSEITRNAIITKIPTVQVSMSIYDLNHGMVLGLIAGTMGAIYPAYKAARIAPVKALSFK